jgi:uncharacterized protein (TIGR04141 family)
MSKIRPFSIYLLRQGFSGVSALSEDHTLQKADSPALPEGSSIYILDKMPTEPWWKAYFRLGIELKQAGKGALVFLPVGDRFFALSFGHVYHNLRDEAYEHDFGLKVTLNCVDPKELKSTDTLEPGAARRQRTQLPVGSDLTFFDFDQDTSILKSLTGKVLDVYKELFTHVTGSSSLLIKSEIPVAGLVNFCKVLLELYMRNDYRTTFPEIENVVPVRNPAVLARLDDKLIEALREKSQSVYLTIPDILDYRQIGYFAEFSGVGSSLQYPDVFINKYYEYLESHGHAIDAIDSVEFASHRLKLTDGDGKAHRSYSLLKCLIFDTALDAGTQSFHLTDGQWYKVENSYIAKLKGAIDPLCFDLNLPCYDHADEDHYNVAVATADASMVCLHKSNIAPPGQRMIEPCDLYSVEDGTAVFHHVKRSTVSMQLSHLFNQGVNSIELIKGETACFERLKTVINENALPDRTEVLTAPCDNERFRVVFCVVTHKDKNNKSENLPLFSRVSLMRAARRLRMYSTECRLGFIEDRSESLAGIKRKRKPRSSNKTALMVQPT